MAYNNYPLLHVDPFRPFKLSLKMSLFAEIMSGDLLDDLMSSEGTFGCDDVRNVYTKSFRLSILYVLLKSSHCFFSFRFPRQCSHPSSAFPHRRVTTTTSTTWTKRKACVTSLMSPFSTSDPRDCQSGTLFKTNIYFECPSAEGEWKERCRKANTLISAEGLPCNTELNLNSTSSSTFSLVRKHRQEQNILVTAFPRVKSK